MQSVARAFWNGALVGLVLLPFLEKMKPSAQHDMRWYLVLLTVQHVNQIPFSLKQPRWCWVVDIIPGWSQDKAVAETSVLRSIPGFAVSAIVSFSPISIATGWLSVDKNTRTNNHAQPVVGPHLVVVLTSVVHTQSFIETGMSLIPCPFKSVAKLSMECRIRYLGLDSREDLYSATVCLEPP